MADEVRSVVSRQNMLYEISRFRKNRGKINRDKLRSVIYTIYRTDRAIKSRKPVRANRTISNDFVGRVFISANE